MMPSSQKASFSTVWQPKAGEQLVVVQAKVSLQSSGVPARHPVVALAPAPGAQVSVPLHRFESLQAESFGVKTQAPVAGLHVSEVQDRLSLQGAGGVPETHLPGLPWLRSHVSTPLQAFPSLQFALAVQEAPQPAAVQAWPLGHEALLYCTTHESVLSLHTSDVQAITSVGGQTIAVPATHPVAFVAAAGLHTSVPLQYWPSLQAALLGV
jgi:hypothetical protein